MVGGKRTFTVALAVRPVPPSVDVTALVVLFSVPVNVAVTFTVKVQDVLGARLAPASVMLVPAATAVIVPPPQDPLRPFGVATIRPVGKLSVNPIPVSATVFAAGFVIVKLKVAPAFCAMEAAPKLFVIVGGAATAMLADAAAPFPPSTELTVVVVLICAPATVPVTLTVIAQELLPAIPPPLSTTLFDPAVAVTVPPQVFVNAFGLDTTSPEGSASVNPTPLSA